MGYPSPNKETAEGAPLCNENLGLYFRGWTGKREAVEEGAVLLLRIKLFLRNTHGMVAVFAVQEGRLDEAEVWVPSPIMEGPG